MVDPSGQYADIGVGLGGGRILQFKADGGPKLASALLLVAGVSWEVPGVGTGVAVVSLAGAGAVVSYYFVNDVLAPGVDIGWTPRGRVKVMGKAITFSPTSKGTYADQATNQLKAASSHLKKMRTSTPGSPNWNDWKKTVKNVISRLKARLDRVRGADRPKLEEEDRTGRENVQTAIEERVMMPPSAHVIGPAHDYE